MTTSRSEVRIDLARGLLRLWIVLTVLWLAFVGWLAWDGVHSATGGRWQYAVEMKAEDKPWEKYDPSKSFDEVFQVPSKAIHPPSFSKVEYRYLKGFDEFVAEGRMLLIEFPDASSIYLNKEFAKSEQELVSGWFWERRWGRRWDALQKEMWLLPFALIPPLALLLLGFVVRWIVRGFRAA